MKLDDLKAPGATPLPRLWTKTGGTRDQMLPLAQVLEDVSRRIPDLKTLPVLILNSYLFDDNKRLAYPDILGGQNIPAGHMRKLAEATGIRLPERPMIVLANMTAFGIPGIYRRKNAPKLIAHEIGHATGLAHLTEAGNLMHPHKHGALLNPEQIARIRRWVDYFQGLFKSGSSQLPR
jgi:hypothetical protein